MSRRYVTVFAPLLLAAAGVLGQACGGPSGPSGFGLGPGDAGDGSPLQGTDSGSGLPDSMIQLGDTGSDSGKTTSPKDAGPPPAAPVFVYAESPDTLYSLDPTSDAIKVVAPFSGDCTSTSTDNGGGPDPDCTTDCCDVTDLALDQDSNAYVTTFNALYSLDLTLATTKLIAIGSYPNSLSFVPKGTLDPTAEALVGYNGAAYVQINTTTGAVTTVGGLTGGYASSGDIVSVIGGGTFLTVTGPTCTTGDCLLQVDPKTGDLVQNYGSTGNTAVYGIAFWAGTVYGFDDEGDVFSIGYSSGSIVTTPITVPDPPADLEFWGAGSTTSAPKAQPDGGGIPVLM